MNTPIDHRPRRGLVPTSARTVDQLAPWVAAGILGAAELHGAAVLVRADPRADDLVALAAALAIWAPLNGHACIDLGAVEATVTPAVGRRRADDSPNAVIPLDTLVAPNLASITWPTLADWTGAIAGTTICRQVDAHEPPGPGLYDSCPLVLFGHLLYTQRQWIDECIVAAELIRRATTATMPLSTEVSALLDRMLAPVVDGEPNGQHLAAQAALTSAVAVIVGGPGTGKTHTIARLLVAADSLAQHSGRPIRIALAAPTGKAAARMGESLHAALESLSELLDDPQAAAALVQRLTALSPMTIHRLLGARGQSTRFEHDAANPIDADLLVIDEASMVPLPLMARLLEALRPDAPLVLVGDPDQLESIDVGSVLADIVGAAGVPGSSIGTRVVRLTRPHRQAAGSPIAPLAEAIRRGDAETVLASLRAGDPLVTFVDTIGGLGRAATAEAEEAVREAILAPVLAAAAFAADGHAEAALDELATVRVLCARRTGPNGAQRWNQRIEGWVRGTDASAPDVIGRALIATRNDPRQRIANGDTGVLVATAAGRRAAFRTVAGIRWFAPAQLETIETAYAMTIHKSQGSEYDTVVVVLPPVDSPLIGRELLYTAVTRATRRVVVIGSSAAVAACVHSPTQRITGLAAALSAGR